MIVKHLFLSVEVVQRLSLFAVVEDLFFFVPLEHFFNLWLWSSFFFHVMVIEVLASAVVVCFCLHVVVEYVSLCLVVRCLSYCVFDFRHSCSSGEQNTNHSKYLLFPNLMSHLILKVSVGILSDKFCVHYKRGILSHSKCPRRYVWKRCWMDSLGQWPRTHSHKTILIFCDTLLYWKCNINGTIFPIEFQQKLKKSKE